MAYDNNLEQRIDALINGWNLQSAKKKMFGGLSYLLNGNMCFAILGNELLLWAEPVEVAEYLDIPGIHIATMGNRVMKNWLLMGGTSIETDKKLMTFLEAGRDRALSLPPKV